MFKSSLTHAPVWISAVSLMDNVSVTTLYDQYINSYFLTGLYNKCKLPKPSEYTALPVRMFTADFLVQMFDEEYTDSSNKGREVTFPSLSFSLSQKKKQHIITLITQCNIKNYL